MTLPSSSRAIRVLLAAVAASELVVQFVWGHGRLLEPPNRASLFRFPEFAHLNPPENYDDNQLFCGNFDTQYLHNGGKCGICGDPYNETVPRTHEDGGENYRGIIVRGYRSGQIFPVEVDLTASHLGYLEFRLCAKDDASSHLSQECYDEHVLKIADKNGPTAETKYKIPVRGEPFYARYNLAFPKGITCQHCVLQWHYQTGNRWGNCTDGTEAMGCGDQEVFRACSDIIIYPEDTDESKIVRRPNSRYGVFRPHEIGNEVTETETQDTDNGAISSTVSSTSSTSQSSQFLFDIFSQHKHPIHG